MVRLFRSVCAVALAAAVLGLSPASEPPSLTEDQRRELTLFGIKAMGLNAGLGDIKDTPSNTEIVELIEVGLNLNGHLCAGLVSVRPLELDHTYEAVCVAYRGGSARKSYVIRALEGIAFEQ